MSFTSDQLDDLRGAYASGAKSVRDADGKTVVFRSLDELARLIAELEQDVEGNTRRPMFSFTSFRRG